MIDTPPVHEGLEALEDGFCMVDREWRVCYWNAAAARLLEKAREEVLGTDLRESVPIFARPPAARQLDEAMRDGAPAEMRLPDLPGLPASGLFLRAVPLADGGLALYLRDDSARPPLGAEHDRLLESIRDGFVALDAEGGIVYLNSVAERLLRLPRDAVVGTPVWPLLPREPAELEESLRATIVDGRPRHLKRIRAEGEVFRDHFFDVRLHPLADGGASVFFRDVTRAVRRERDLARYAADAEEANRSKGRFFAAVSHELRTPLNALIGYTHLLSTSTYGDLPAAALRAATRAGVCAEHLARIVDDLLLMTTAEIDRLPVVASPIELASFLPSALEPIRQQAEAKGLAFVVEVAAETPALATDPDRLRQLLGALVTNAVKFTSRGEVRIEVRPRPRPAGEATDAPEPEGGVRIRVIDTGPGIPREAQQRIFEAFEQLGNQSRTDSLRRGAGLGLTVARHLARLLNGGLSLERSGADGSVFRLDLPPRPLAA